MKILLIDDHELFRAGIKLLLADLSAELAFAEAANREQALALGARDGIDIVLLDLHLPGTRGLGLLAELRQASERAMIVVMSADDDPALIRAAIEAGAAGFIPKTSTHAVMLAALRLVLAGGTYLPPHAMLESHPSEVPAALPATAQSYASQALRNLTQRQIDTLRLAIQGKANKVIARDLDISEATVKAHLSASFRALGVANRTEAVFVVASSRLVA